MGKGLVPIDPYGCAMCYDACIFSVKTIKLLITIYIHTIITPTWD